MFNKSTSALIEKSSSKSINGAPEECILVEVSATIYFLLLIVSILYFANFDKFLPSFA